MSNRIEIFLAEQAAKKDRLESERLRPQVEEALDSLHQEGLQDVSENQIISRIRRIHKPRNIFDQIGKYAMGLTLEDLEFEGIIESTSVRSKIGNKIKEIVLYRHIPAAQNPTPETA